MTLTKADDQQPQALPSSQEPGQEGPAINPTTTDQEADAKKSKNQIKNDAKRAAKLAKFQAKQAAQASKASKASNPSPSTSISSSKQAKRKDGDAAIEASSEDPAVYVDTTEPGKKKVLKDEIQRSYRPSYVEKAWMDWWVASKVHSPTLPITKSLQRKAFVIPIPPPNVTGYLHIGHAIGVAIQDALIRFKRMQGFATLFIPGCDHAGIATQSVVEKSLWRRSRITRHDMGREAFVEKVWEWRRQYGSHIYTQLKRMGAAYDWDRVRFTMDPEMVDAVQEAFMVMYERGLIYRDTKLVNWCCKLNTALSNLEVDNRELTGRTLMKVPGHEGTYEFGVITEFAYELEQPAGDQSRIVVATTRIETMLGDTAVAVHPKDGRYSHLIGKTLRHPFVKGRSLRIVADDYVDMNFGTGAVKITPAHDFNDYEVGKRHGLPFINILNDDGTINEHGGEFEGLLRFDARLKVLARLKELGLYVGTKDNPMKIPICSRSGDVIEPYLKPQWWVKCDGMAKRAMDAVTNGDLVVQPQASEKEWFRWLGNIRDWCISRQLWWGHRIPAFHVNIKDGRTCDELDKHYWIVAKTIEEAKAKAKERFPEVETSLIELEQDPDVLDTWFSSGIWPFSTLGWPNTKNIDFQNFYPNTVLETGWDILFFWVARMVMMGLELTGKCPFQNVFCHAMVRDAHGRKMSKSLGNVIDPIDVINGISLEHLAQKLEQGNLDPAEVVRAKAGQKSDFPKGIPECGADALRFTLCAYTSTGRDLNLNILRVEGYRKFCNKLWNATRFALMTVHGAPKEAVLRYSQSVLESNAEGTSDDSITVESLGGGDLGSCSLVERWILGRLSETVKDATEGLNEFNFMGTTTVIHNFWLYDLCGVFVEAVKVLLRLAADDNDEKISNRVRHTLFVCIDYGLKLLHPFMPFVTEELWQRLHKDHPSEIGSIAQQRWPRQLKQTQGLESDKKQFGTVHEVIKQVRSLVGDYMIQGSTEVHLLCGNPETLELMYSQAKLIQALAGRQVSTVNVTSSPPDIPHGCAVANIHESLSVHVLVQGHVDIPAELEKLSTKLANANEAIRKLLDRMTIPQYETKVKPEVQRVNQDKLATLREEVRVMERCLDNFHKLQGAGER